MRQNRIDFNIMDDNVLDSIVDHDVYNSRPRRQAEQAQERRIEERDAPQTQLQIVEV